MCYNTVMVLKDTELYWVAGLLEGEVYFDSTNRLSVTCSMVDKEPIKKLYNICGGAYYGLHSRTSTGKPVYRWYIGRRNGSIDLVKLLLPLMSPRRQVQLKLMLKQDIVQHKNNWSLTHGTLYGYEGHKCRCNACKAAENQYRNKRRKKMTYLTKKL